MLETIGDSEKLEAALAFVAILIDCIAIVGDQIEVSV